MAIGQESSQFTPLQLANYIATLVGNGEHYAAHLLKNVKTYNNSAVVYAYDKDPVNVVEMQDSTVEAIKTGMHDLTTGSLSTYFSKCVVSVSAKTSYLINNDVTSNSSKNKKARELGIPILSEEDFLKMIGEEKNAD